MEERTVRLEKRSSSLDALLSSSFHPKQPPDVACSDSLARLGIHNVMCTHTWQVVKAHERRGNACMGKMHLGLELANRSIKADYL